MIFIVMFICFFATAHISYSMGKLRGYQSGIDETERMLDQEVLKKWNKYKMRDKKK